MNSGTDAGRLLSEQLEQHLEACHDQLSACTSVLDGEPIAIDGYEVSTRFHHLQFDTNKRPKTKELAECLVDHLVSFCFSIARRGSPSTLPAHGRLVREAKAQLLRLAKKGGESGEILLYLLLEAILKAPQVVAKMDLKTNRNDEVKGSDGIHMKWDSEAELLDIYFGEAKLYQSVSSALSSAFKSIEEFYEHGGFDRETGIVTSHFKFTDGAFRKAVLRYLDRHNPSAPDCRINHGILIGYDWKEYSSLDFQLALSDYKEDFVARYSKETTRLLKLLKKRLDDFSRPSLRFEVFFLPFESVQDFRDYFIKTIRGPEAKG